MSHEIVALNSHLLEAKVTIDKLSEDNVSAGAFTHRGHQTDARAPQESGTGKVTVTWVLRAPCGTGDENGQGTWDFKADRDLRLPADLLLQGLKPRIPGCVVQCQVKLSEPKVGHGHSGLLPWATLRVAWELCHPWA